MSTPRVAAIHDLSGFGRCSLTVVLPTLSAMGVQCCPLPTAVLSTHTGGLGANTFLDLTDQIVPFTAHWRSLELHFDGLYTGFMGSEQQIALTADFIRTFQSPKATVVVDPVMGDHGKPYRTYTPEMCRAMGQLAELADVLTPNRTEAALLLGVKYEDLRLDSETDCRRWAEALSMDGRRSVVLTGAELAEDTVGAVCFDRGTGKTSLVQETKIAGQFHGTGDLFASVLTGALVSGKSLTEATGQAAWFTRLAVQRTAEQGLPAREGVDFEPLLWRLSNFSVSAFQSGQAMIECERKFSGNGGTQP